MSLSGSQGCSPFLPGWLPPEEACSLAEPSGPRQMSLLGACFYLWSPPCGQREREKGWAGRGLGFVEGTGVWGGGLFPAFSCRFM